MVDITRRIATAREYGDSKVAALTEEFERMNVRPGDDVQISLTEDEQGARSITIAKIAKPKK